ncbi:MULTISPECIES: sensor histidine kinase KdpD [unclassified Sphingomonas]|uniref:sensor histidine kinase n=1 Tax=unclassified Sphingomonas TaxID=196159 RepID=UPI002150A099|nr:MULTISPECIES: HAMP domain-containing sensor histidine kinase [unclassified Sphingomonas]MCR5871212.1 HAMP domain-containing histidine kinase [Sphingomonas sp. J344]UUY00478.1 HAMP domain-containing histidine kinase [Sphingomonas sp. J315]
MASPLAQAGDWAFNREMQPGAVSDRVTIRATESRIEFFLAGAFSLLVGGTLAYVHLLFAPIAPPGPLWGWTIFTALVVASMIGLPLSVYLLKPDDATVVRVFAPLGKVVAVLFDLAVASSVWALLPYASEALQLLMVVFYAATISGQVISTAEAIENIVFGVVSIFGSAAVFFLINPGPYSVPLALFLVAFGALMIGVAVVLKVAIRSTIEARLRAERVSDELAAALTEVTEARTSKTRFIAAATHDLRQPLQAAALFFNRVAVGKGRDRQDAVAKARLAFDEAAHLLDRLLDHLRLDSGIIQPTIERLDLAELLKRICTETAPVCGASDFDLRCIPGRRHATGDPHLVLRALRNLIHNAVRHSRGTRVLIGTRRVGKFVRVYVLDNGRGISSDQAGRMFIEFAGYGDGPATGRGVGLGLPSSRRMAQLIGGTVAHDPRWRRGAALYLELPGPG